ncbi:MAG: DUF4136 domain-containing protein [Bacteroidales bacterium]|jgi:hypothetical protein|nr:DUF4136 domain-containing protein [Bacteroidales bacterium]
MQKTVLTILFAWVCLALCGQDKPLWLESDFRSAKFPNAAFLTGYAEGNINTNENTEKAVERIKTIAQSNLIENLRVTMKSNTQSSINAVSSGNNYYETEMFGNQTSKEAHAEITGMKVESYIDKKTNYVYAFAYANRYEIIGFHKSNLSVKILQIESSFKTADDLIESGEKAKARKQIESVKPLLESVRYSQYMLIALDPNLTIEDLQQRKTEQLQDEFTLTLASLAQGIYIFMENDENMFGQEVDIVSNKLKSELAVKGCAFVDNSEKADFLLRIKASTRESSASETIVFCYADVVIELFDTHKQKTVYSDELSEKGGSSSREKAARKAMENAVVKISDKISSWIK